MNNVENDIILTNPTQQVVFAPGGGGVSHIDKVMYVPASLIAFAWNMVFSNQVGGGEEV